ncbi:trypsin alpha-like [Macrosteles quadrilineatus]|uniref:trypsin alpha-like n=1 Tax=Macrosteles quadrilineatus TaxID=74068 RepID=UPI0023E0FEC1|nr:trypsin alpha-like [Macrosteles quadrilineatus]
MVSTSVVLLLCIIGATYAEQQFIGKLPNRKRSQNSLYIFNGNKTSITKYPYIASLEQYGEEYGAAVVLNKNWLLTTGWNVDPEWIPTADLTFRVGSSFYNKQGQVLKPGKVVIHPNYTGDGWDYDIALVKVKKPIKLGKKVKAITLGTKSLKPNTKAWTAGWGYDATENIPKSILEAQITVYNRKKCVGTYGDYLTPRLFCTLDQNVAACPYDFGDPVVVDGVLYGLFAGGYTCSPGSYPVLYTDVPSLQDWVQSVITKDLEEQE